MARHLLTAPGGKRNSLTAKSVSGTVANLTWTRPHYADLLGRRFGAEVDYRNRPSEDFARGVVALEDEDGNELMIEATTSWAYVGAGLRSPGRPASGMTRHSVGYGLRPNPISTPAW